MPALSEAAFSALSSAQPVQDRATRNNSLWTLSLSKRLNGANSKSAHGGFDRLIRQQIIPLY